MLKPASDLLFASIDGIPVLDKEQASKEILSIPDNYSWWDEYRNTKMIPLMTKNGELSRDGSSNFNAGDFSWVSYTPKIITDWFEEFVFPWLGERSRVMALFTMPGMANKEHIDCNRNELNTLQHKFRIVLQGKTDTLYWMTDKGNVAAPNIDKAFIMDGGWPHGMINTTDQVKVTIALGAPWNGKDKYNDITLLQRRSDYVMPNKINHLWNDN